MKTTLLRYRLARAMSLHLFALILICFGWPCSIQAQTLQHEFSFTSNASDSVGGANGTLVGNAYITNGTLVLPGGGTSANPDGYVQLPNGIVSNDTSIAVECWLKDNGGLVWAEAWCFGDSAAGAGQTPTTGTAYISLIPHSGSGDFRGAFNLTGTDEIDVIDAAGPMPTGAEEYAVVTYNASNTTATLYLNGVQVGVATIPTNLAPANFGNTFNDWIGRDEFGVNPMFEGSIDELRIWNGSVSPLYVAVSAVAGPNVVVTNLAPLSVNVAVAATNMNGGQTQQATVTGNFLQASNVPVGASAVWTTSDTNVLTVNSSGLVTAVSSGSATVSATVDGVTGTSASITVASAFNGWAATVGYWQFNNPANLGFDSGGLTNTLTTASGAPTYSSNGLFGGALYLNGTSTMTTLSGAFPTGGPTGAHPYTIAVWEKIATGCPNTGGLVGWGVNATSEDNDLRLNGANSLDNYWYGNDFTVSGLATNLMDGNWHAIAVTWDGTTETMYVDGANVGTRTPTAPNIHGTGFVVGGQTSGVDFEGWIENLLIANIALSPAEIAVYQTGIWPLAAEPALPTASPSNTVYAGTTVTLNEVAAGTPPFQYQWQEDGTNISWGTAAALVLTNATTTNSGSYDVIVGNSYGTNASAALALTVNPASAPVFAEQPTPAVAQVYQGGSVTFTAAVVGTLPITLQWEQNGTNLAGQTLASLSLTNLQTNESGEYDLLASNSIGTNLSASASLTVLTPATNVNEQPITVGYWQFNNPANLGFDSGGLTNNLTMASGAPTYSSNGLFGGALYLNGTSTMTTLSGAFPTGAPTGAHAYSIAVWEKIDTGCPNAGGFVGWGANATSEANNLRLNGTNSVDNYWYGNDFTVSGLAANPMDGNWHAIASTWDGTTETMYVDGIKVGTRTPTAPNVHGTGFVVGATTAAGDFKGWMENLLIANAALSPAQIALYQTGTWPLSAEPELPTASPSNTVAAGTTVTLNVVVAGTPPFQYQWQDDGTNIPWGTAAALVLTNAMATNSGSYDVIVGNASGTNTSPALTLTVNPASPPTFSMQPTPAVAQVYQNGSVTFTAAVVGTLPIALQWEQNGTNLAGQTLASLTLHDLQTNESGEYNLLASNSVGTNLSASASLTVLPLPTNTDEQAVTVGFWQFNNSTNLGLDSSGLGNNLTTASGAPAYSSNGLFGGALYLNGSSTMTTLSGAFPAGVPTGARPYTIAVWEKIATGCPNTGGIVGWGVNVASEANNLRLNGANGVDDYWYANDFAVSGLAANPMDGNWHAIAVTWDGTTETMYVDGVSVGTRTPTAPNVHGTGFVVGGQTSGVDFEGWIENLLIANVALSPAEIAVYQTGTWPLSAEPELPTASPSSTVYDGTTVTLNVVVAGPPPFQYQWQVNGTNISWGTSAALVLTNAMTTNSGSYDVIVGNQSGSNTSPALALTILPLPNNVDERAVTVGYWQFSNPTNLGFDSGGLTNTLTTASGTPGYSSSGLFGGALYLNGSSTMTSLPGTLPTGLPIGANPYSIAVWERVDTGCPNTGGFVGWGANVAGEDNDLRLNGANSVDDYWFANDFVVSGLAANPMDGNWHAIAVTWDGTTQTMYVDGVNVGTRTPTAPNVHGVNFIVGATTGGADFKGWMENLLIANVALPLGEIAVYQTGVWPLAAEPALPTASPSNTAYAGTTVTLNVVVAGTPPFQYQWQEDGTNISWGTGAALVLTNAMTTNSGSYDVIVGNASGTNTSAVLTLTVNPASAPIFAMQPTPAVVEKYQSGSVTFTATAAGTLPISYQWQENGTNLAGQTQSSLLLLGLQTNESGEYSLLASNSLGTNLSASASLTVLPLPTNFNDWAVTVGYWQFNNSTNLGFDSSGLSNNLATLSGAPAYSSAGLFGGALYLNGASTMTTLSGAFPTGVPNGVNPYTIAVWEKVDTGCPTTGGFVGWGANVTSGDNDLRLNGTNSLDDYWFANDFIVSDLAVNPMDGNWHAIAVTWNGVAQTMYVDGVSVGTRIPTVPDIQSTGFIVGATTAAADFKGWMENLLIANVALPPAEIAVYQTGTWPVSAQPALPTAYPSSTPYAGTTVTLSVAVAGTPPFQYQWQEDGTNISWGTEAALVLTNATAANSGSYDVIVGNQFGTNTSPALTLTVNPASGPVFTMQPTPAAQEAYQDGLATITTEVVGTFPIYFQWQQNGTNLAGQTQSTLVLPDLQTNESGEYSLLVSNVLGTNLSSSASLTILPLPTNSAVNMLTYQYDIGRSGANTNEFLLTPETVSTNTFGKLFTIPVDGAVYAQPLYVAGLALPGLGTHNVVFVATQHGSIYAFDADSNEGADASPLWHTSIINPSAGVTPLGSADVNNCPNIPYEDCIAATPVINLASGTIYFEAITREATNNVITYVHRLHGLNITNGAEQAGSPVVITGSVPGTGAGGNGTTITFSPILQQCRTGLLLVNGFLYLGYSSQCDEGAYHGWVMAYNAQTLQQAGIYNDTPNGTQGGIWHGSGGLAADAQSNIFAMTGNGTFGVNYSSMAQYNLSESFLKFTASNGLTLVDYFTPHNQAALTGADLDISAGSPLVLPDSVGSAAHPHLMLGCGKAGTIYLLDRSNLGHYNAANDNQIVQELPGAVGTPWSDPVPAYFNNTIFYNGNADVMRAFQISGAVINPNPVATSSVVFASPGGNPSVSANGTNDAIVWVIETDAWNTGGPSILHAYNATNLVELYNSSQDFARDNPGGAVKWAIPTVANGKVYVGQEMTLNVYGNGIFLSEPSIIPNGGSFTNSLNVTLTEGSAGASVYYTLDGTNPTTNSTLYTGPFELTNSVTVTAAAFEDGAVPSGSVSASFLDTSASGNGSGLLGQYWANTTNTAFTNAAFNATPTLTRIDPTIDFNWTTNPPATNVGPENYCVQWTGTVEPQFSETYTFTATVDDGVLLWINGQLLINKWTQQSQGTWSNTISMVAQQRYNIEMDYYQGNGNAGAYLYWNSPSTPMAIVPEAQLYPVTNPPPSVVMTAPSNGASYTASASVTLSADAATQFNTLNGVSFHLGTNLVGTVSDPPYSLTTTGLQAGSYTLTATAFDGSGLASTSAPVNITVNAGSGLPYGLTNYTAAPAYYNMPPLFTGPLPALLSLTGIFTNTPAMTPVASLISYSPNVQLFSDNAQKVRYFSIPNSGAPYTPSEQITYAPTGTWSFPDGTVFVKTFELQTNLSDPNSLLRLETRLLVRDTNGAVYGVTYKWRSDYSDADLLTTSQTEPILIQTPTGVYTNLWYYPSPGDCLQCHTAAANYVLGVNARQLNGPNTYPNGVTDNQLRALNRTGLFNPAIDESTISNIEYLSAVTNPAASYVQRARSYLDANCAQCHQPGGPGPTFDARYDTPLANQNIINTPALFNLGYDNVDIVSPNDLWRSSLYDRMDVVNPTYQMPPLARYLIDTNAVQLMAEWIGSLGGPPTLPPPTLTPFGGTFTESVSVTGEDATNDVTMYYTLDGSLPTTNSMLYTGPILLTNSVAVNINAWAPGYTNSVIATAQYTVLPGIFFLSSGGFTNGMFQMAFSGPVGSNYVLQVSSNLMQWTSISTNTPATSPFVLTDPSTPGVARFYRVFMQVP